MSERTSSESVDNFLKCVIHLYTNVYLRTPTQDDVNRLYQKHDEVHGFKGMLGIIDCMHWKWDQCINAYKGKYTRGGHGYPMVMLEVVASYDRWIWYAYFGVVGSNNDINVLKQSSLFHDMLNDSSPNYRFTVNGYGYNKGYYLADVYIRSRLHLLKLFRTHLTNRVKHSNVFKRVRERISNGHSVFFKVVGDYKTCSDILQDEQEELCIILHNMFVEDNIRSICDAQEWYAPLVTGVPRTYNERVNESIRINREIRDENTHNTLREDLVAYISTLADDYRQR